MKVKINFYNDERNGRTVATSFHGGSWLLVRWNDLPENIQWLLAEMSNHTEVEVQQIPWLEDWQNGK